MRRQKGFTLVELMVVITILGILIALAVTNMGPVRERAKEARVMAGMGEIVRALELFYQENNAYPGVALPKCDDDGFSPFYDDTGDPDLYTMRGVLGGGFVAHDRLVNPYLDTFYFEVDPAIGDGSGTDALPDRLRAGGFIENYPQNPFRKNVAGLTNQEIPMLNIWGIEFENSPIDLLNESRGFHISYPFVYEGITPGEYNFPSYTDYGGGVADFDMWYLGDSRGTVWGADQSVPDYAVTSGELMKYFPEGDFAYIPLDPVQTDSTNEQFMRSCKNYWIIIYGAKRSALKNKYQNIWPHFPRPLGNGIHDPADPAAGMNDFEWTVKAALTGAMHVYGTAYTDQINVAGSD